MIAYRVPTDKVQYVKEYLIGERTVREWIGTLINNGGVLGWALGISLKVIIEIGVASICAGILTLVAALIIELTTTRIEITSPLLKQAHVLNISIESTAVMILWIIITGGVYVTNTKCKLVQVEPLS